MRYLRSILPAAALLAAPMIGAAPAQAATIVSGVTAVTLTAAPTLRDLGLSISPFGLAMLATDGIDPPVASFIITGGTLDEEDGSLLIAHDGSGLRFTAGSATLEIGDFLIDTEEGLVTGSAFANGGALGTVPLFTLNSDLELFLTETAAGAFVQVFDAPDLSGVLIGTAAPSFQTAIPEPQSWALMIGGFALLGGTLRRRRAIAAPACA